MLLPVNAAVAGTWGSWGGWSGWSTNCGSGSQTRTRLCTAASYCNAGCSGASSQTQSSTTIGAYSSWVRVFFFLRGSYLRVFSSQHYSPFYSNLINLFVPMSCRPRWCCLTGIGWWHPSTQHCNRMLLCMNACAFGCLTRMSHSTYSTWPTRSRCPPRLCSKKDKEYF